MPEEKKNYQQLMNGDCPTCGSSDHLFEFSPHEETFIQCAMCETSMRLDHHKRTAK